MSDQCELGYYMVAMRAVLVRMANEKRYIKPEAGLNPSRCIEAMTLIRLGTKDDLCGYDIIIGTPSGLRDVHEYINKYIQDCKKRQLVWSPPLP